MSAQAGSKFQVPDARLVPVALLIMVGLAVHAQEAPVVTVVAEDPIEAGWPVSGTSTLPEYSRLQVHAYRIVRFAPSDLNASFQETLSTTDPIRTAAEVRRGAWRALLGGRACGWYRVDVSTEETLAGSIRSLMGRPDFTLGRSKEHVFALIKGIDDMKAVVKDLRRSLKTASDPDARSAFLTKLAAMSEKLEMLMVESDLTATIAGLGDAYDLIRNAQVWGGSRKGAGEMEGGDDVVLEGGGPDGEDGEAEKPGYEPTLKDVENVLATLKATLSREIRVSVSEMLDSLFGRIEINPKLLDSSGEWVKGATQAVTAAPEQDPAFSEILASMEKLKTPPEVKEARVRLQEYLRVNVKRL